MSLNSKFESFFLFLKDELVCQALFNQDHVKLKEIYISENEMDEMAVGEFLRFIQNCQHLEVFVCKYIDCSKISDAEILTPFFGKNHLKTFIFKFCLVSFSEENTLKAFFEGKNDLVNFNVSGNNLNDKCFEVLLDELNNQKGLKSLGISLVDFMSENYEISVSLTEKAKWLKNINSLDISLKSKYNFPDFKTIFESLSFLKYLDVQFIDGNYLRRKNYHLMSCSADTYYAIFEEDEHFNEFHSILDEYALLLLGNMILNSLILHQCNLTDELLNDLLRDQEKLVHLEKIDVSRNPISNDGLKKIINVIKHENIVSINFEDTNRTWKFMFFFENIQKNFEKLKYLNLRKHKEKISLEKLYNFLKGISKIMKNIKKLLIMYDWEISSNFEFSEVLTDFSELILFNYEVPLGFEKSENRDIFTLENYLWKI